MNVLVIGSGGREHVLCWKLAQSARVDKVYCAPGNAGIKQHAECVDIPADKLEALADFAVSHQIDFTVVGPEAPLCAGIVDLFRSRGLKIFGPTQAAARLEGSKDFAKAFMVKHHIPTAQSATFTHQIGAVEYIAKQFDRGARGVVVKADGLAAGKGVLVAYDPDSAIDFVSDCFNGAFGSSGKKILIEECLFGEEASILALTDGKTIVPLASAQDHKRAFDNDEGPNTGGMGAYSPAPVVDAAMMERIQSEILTPFLKGVQADKLDYKGIIFVGIMITDDGPKVLEFNVRFGDPEVQAVLRRFEGDLLDVMQKTVDGRLDEAELRWNDQPAVCVVLASGGYPEHYEKGYPIFGLEAAGATGAIVFHAGTAEKCGEIITAGGRVLGVTALGATITEAIDKVYEAVDLIEWDDCFCRRDIGFRALARQKK